MNRENGFTVLELLLIIAMITILASVVVVPTFNIYSKAGKIKEKIKTDQALDEADLTFLRKNYPIVHAALGPQLSLLAKKKYDKPTPQDSESTRKLETEKPKTLDTEKGVSISTQKNLKKMLLASLSSQIYFLNHDRKLYMTHYPGDKAIIKEIDSAIAKLEVVIKDVKALKL